MSGLIHSGVQEINELSETNSNDVHTRTKYSQAQTQAGKSFVCELCNIKATSQVLLQKHLDGKKHLMREQRNGKTFDCEICQVIANSQKQLETHLRSSRHKATQARKERLEFMYLSYSKGTWIILFGVICVFLNLLILFKMIL